MEFQLKGHFLSADTIHLIESWYFGDAVRCTVSHWLKMVARNPPLIQLSQKMFIPHFKNIVCVFVGQYKNYPLFLQIDECN